MTRFVSWILAAGTLTALLTGATSAAHAQGPAGNTAWAPLEFLVGEWTGEGSGDPGQGAGGFTFKWDLDKKVLLRTNFADYPASKERPAFSHRDLMVIYADSAGGSLRAIYFDNEGHVINYAVRTSQNPYLVEFVSDPTPKSPGYRLSYGKTGDAAVTIKFDIAPPGQAFSTYIEARAHRK